MTVTSKQSPDRVDIFGETTVNETLEETNKEESIKNIPTLSEIRSQKGSHYQLSKKLIVEKIPASETHRRAQSAAKHF